MYAKHEQLELVICHVCSLDYMSIHGAYVCPLCHSLACCLSLSLPCISPRRVFQLATTQKAIQERHESAPTTSDPSLARVPDGYLSHPPPLWERVMGPRRGFFPPCLTLSSASSASAVYCRPILGKQVLAGSDEAECRGDETAFKRGSTWGRMSIGVRMRTRIMLASMLKRTALRPHPEHRFLYTLNLSSRQLTYQSR
ncbi:hypothetical protein BDR03DRAFT_127384 [Suillus americanus]|nr:hypothetical protein BDR03DRAFT_127384 [Suillus americanus]